MTHLHKYKETTYFDGNENEDVIKCILEPTCENLFSLLPIELRYMIVNLVYVKYELQPLTFTKYNEFLEYLKLYSIDKQPRFEIKIADYSSIIHLKKLSYANRLCIIFHGKPFDTLIVGQCKESESMKFHYRGVINSIASLSIIPIPAKN